jgi:hypothetical protein
MYTIEEGKGRGAELGYNNIHKKIPSGLGLIYSIFLYGTFLPVSFPPIFDMGEILEEFEGDILPIGKIVNTEITF